MSSRIEPVCIFAGTCGVRAHTDAKLIVDGCGGGAVPERGSMWLRH
ncbi:MAG: hypothetical protein ACQEXN_14130 [Actinomycetota bacterium]